MADSNFSSYLGWAGLARLSISSGSSNQVVEGDVVVGQKPLDRCGQVVVAQPEVADQLVATVENAAEQLAFLEVRHTNLFDEAFERLHTAMKRLAGLGRQRRQIP